MLELIQRAKVKSMGADNESHELDCNITLSVNGESWKAYAVSVSHCDLLFYTDQGTVAYLIDSYPHGDFAVLYNWERDL